MLCDRALRLTLVLSSLLLCVECCFPVIPVEDCTCDQDIESTFTRLVSTSGPEAALSYSVGKDPATGCSIATVTCRAELVLGSPGINGFSDIQPEVTTAGLVCDAGKWAVDGDPVTPVNEVFCTSICCDPAAQYSDPSTTVSNIIYDPVSGCEASATLTCTSIGPSTLLQFISYGVIPGSADDIPVFSLFATGEASNAKHTPWRNRFICFALLASPAEKRENTATCQTRSSTKEVMLCDRALRLTFVLSGLLLCAKCCFPVIPVEDCTCDQDIESTFTRLDPSDGVAAVLSYSVGKVPATGCSIATVTCDSSTAHPG
uniref:Uncharacterized protein n=1 Tax=Plectus sambesii TaxID=2011161 RepID=A0A914VBS0_9BILA